MNINWYPGHMVKTINEIKASIKLIDIVVEVLDARIPLCSRNPIIDELAVNKQRIVVLNKYDLADKKITDNFKKYFESKGMKVILTNASSGENINKLIETIKIVGNEIYDKKYENKSIEIRPIFRVLIIGIPNVGKSTIINKISKKNSAGVGNKPGVTVRKQWIKVEDNIELLDTPGLLWPRLDDNNAGIKLALTGNIKQDILDIEELSLEGIKILINNNEYKKLLQDKYKLEDMSKEYYEIFEDIGKKRGCLVKGGEINYTKTAEIFIDDMKNGNIGRISLDNI